MQAHFLHWWETNIYAAPHEASGHAGPLLPVYPGHPISLCLAGLARSIPGSSPSHLFAPPCILCTSVQWKSPSTEQTTYL
jgi:hypothetical protein